MDLKASKSVIEHNKFGKLYKYSSKLDNLIQANEAFSSLAFGVESLEAYASSPVNSDYKVDNPALEYHKRYSTNAKFGYMDCCMDNPKFLQQIAGLNIFRGSQENSIRLFISDRTCLDHPIFQNRFCFLLGSLCDKKIDIYAGNSINGYMPLCSLGCLFDALECSVADVTMHICGRCGMSETMLWVHAKNKCITQYGSLYFSGVGRILEMYPMWREYYETVFIKAKNIGLINDQDIVDLLTTNNLIYISATDTLAALNG